MKIKKLLKRVEELELEFEDLSFRLEPWPCLVCTEEAFLDKTRDYYAIACSKCGNRGPWCKSEKAAIAAWNSVYIIEEDDDERT